MQALLKQVIEAHQSLSLDQAHSLLDSILATPPEDPTQQIQLAALIAALATRGETAPEIAGFALAVRSAATPLPLSPHERLQLVDACGTGGDSSNTFNISTAAALVAAAAGATVAKHGNRAVTSRSGSADVLEALGIPITLPPAEAAAALRTHRFAFLHAPSHHPALRAVMPVRRALGIRTLFNIVGPLANPAGAARQVMGVFAPHLVPLVAEAMLSLPVTRALIVFGEATAPPVTPGDPAAISSQPSPTAARPSAQLPANPAQLTTGLDELSLSGPTHLAEVHNGRVTYTTLHLSDLEALGLTPAPLSALAGGDAQTSADILRAIFAGAPGPPRDITLLNAAAILLVADLAPTLPAALARAAHAIDSGAATHLLSSLAQPGTG